jgi:hypothetical protein
MSDTTEVTTLRSPADFAESKAALMKLIENAVQKKPTTKEDAVELLTAIQLAVGPWLVSELPPLQQKAVLLGLWAAGELQSGSCFSFLKR